MPSNMGLEKINASDYVSPDPINRNFDKLDALGIDYVVAQGKSGEWWYRKWNSGRAECGIDAKTFPRQKLVATGFGEDYATAYLSFGAYPFSFSSAPYSCITFQGDTLYSTRASYIVQQHSTSTTQSHSFFIVDASSYDMQPICGVYVTGRYK